MGKTRVALKRQACGYASNAVSQDSCSGAQMAREASESVSPRDLWERQPVWVPFLYGDNERQSMSTCWVVLDRVCMHAFPVQTTEQLCSGTCVDLRGPCCGMTVPSLSLEGTTGLAVNTLGPDGLPP